MSQSGYTPIQLYRTTTASATPSAGNLSAGELAINLTDEKLFFKNTAGVVKLLAASSGAEGTVTSVAASGGTTGLTFSGSPITTSGTLTLGGTLGVTNGGTGATSLTSGYLVKGNGTSAVGASVVYDDGTNVGIGTSSPGNKLSVVGGQINTVADDAYAIALNATTGNVRIYPYSAAYSGSALEAFSAGYAGNGPLSIAASILRFWTGGSERMRIDSSGNLLVGTTSVGAKLTVGSGSIQLDNTFGVNIKDNAGTVETVFAVTSSNNLSIASPTLSGSIQYSVRSSSGLHQFFTAGSERFRITSTGGITSSDLADAVGYKGLPQNAQTSSYTLALSDMGKHISITTGGVVIPANASVAFPIGSAIAIYNNSGSNQTISITSDTLRQAGTANTGSRTLAQYGLCTVTKVASTTWVISGAGVS